MAGGRPPKYSKEELDKKLKEFWVLVNESEGIAPTKERLVVHLDIHRDTFNTWKKEGHQFSDTLKKAESEIEAMVVDQLFYGKNTAGVIFYLKNAYGWRDKHETDITSGGEKINFDDKQINTIADRIAKGKNSDGSASSKETSD